MSWKDNPGIVAVVSGSAVTIFVVTIFFTVVIPTWLKSKDFDIEQLNRKIGGLQQIVSENETEIAKIKSSFQTEENLLKGKILELEENISSLIIENKKLSLIDVFSNEDVYPKGFRKVRIFHPTSKIYEVYSGKEIEELGPTISVEINGPLIDSIVYYFGTFKEVDLITHILFFVNDEKGVHESLYSQLIEKYGSETSSLVEENSEKEWHFSNILNHKLKLGKRTYVIYPVLTSQGSNTPSAQD